MLQAHVELAVVGSDPRTETKKEDGSDIVYTVRKQRALRRDDLIKTPFTIARVGENDGQDRDGIIRLVYALAAAPSKPVRLSRDQKKALKEFTSTTEALSLRHFRERFSWTTGDAKSIVMSLVRLGHVDVVPGGAHDKYRVAGGPS